MVIIMWNVCLIHIWQYSPIFLKFGYVRDKDQQDRSVRKKADLTTLKLRFAGKLLPISKTDF